MSTYFSPTVLKFLTLSIANYVLASFEQLENVAFNDFEPERVSG